MYLPSYRKRKGMKNVDARKRVLARAQGAKKMRQMTRRRKLTGARAIANIRTGGFLGIELKFLDCAFDGVQINTSTDGSSGEVQPSSGCTNALSVPAQGDGESQRDGRKYTIKSIWVSGVLNSAGLTDQTDAIDDFGCYLALVLDTQANGATMVSENVFINPSTSGFSMVPQPLRNLQNSKRYKILASQYVEPLGSYAMTDGANTGSLNAQANPVVSLSWKGNLVCDSIGTTASVASASDNAIHLVAFSGGGFSRTFYGKSRVRFVG